MIGFLAAPLLLFVGLQLIWHYYAWNTPLFQFINGANLGPDWLWQHITMMGDSVTAFVLLIFFARRYPSILWRGFLAAIVLGIGVQAAKHIFLMQRPAAVLGEAQIHIVGHALRHYSFPSGHSVTAFALAALLSHLHAKPYRFVFIALATVVAWSRVVVGAHWPVDVMLGGLVGWYGTLAIVRWTEKWTWGFQTRVGIVVMHLLWLSTAIALWWLPSIYPMAEISARIFMVLSIVCWIWGLPRLKQQFVNL